MERLPSPNNKSELLQDLDNLSTELQRCFLDIEQAKKGLAQTRRDLAENNREYQELLAEIQAEPDPEIREREEQFLNEKQQSFVKIMEDGIAEQEAQISALETIYNQELALFERLKALQRELEHGGSGTAH